MKHIKQFRNLFESNDESFNTDDIIQLVDMNLIALSSLQVFTKMVYFNSILEEAGFSKERMHELAMAVVSYEVFDSSFSHDPSEKMQAVIIAGPIPSIEKLEHGLTGLVDLVHSCEIKQMGDFEKAHTAKWKKLLSRKD